MAESSFFIGLVLRDRERCAELAQGLEAAGYSPICASPIEVPYHLFISDGARPPALDYPWLVLLPPDADAAPWLEAGAWDVLREPLQLSDLLARITLIKKLQTATFQDLEPLKTISNVTLKLLFSPQWEQELPEVLAQLGASISARRFYLYEHRVSKDGSHVLEKRGEWIAPQPEPIRPLPQQIPLTALGLERWAQKLSVGEALIGPFSSFPAYEQRLMRRYALRNLAVIPIHVAEGWWGLLGFDVERAGAYTLSLALQLLRSGANLLGAALRFQSIQKDLMHRTQALELLHTITPLIQNWSALRDLSELGTLALQQVCHVLDAPQVVIWIRSNDQPELQLLAAHGYSPEQGVVPGSVTLQPGEGLAGWVLQHRQGVYAPDVFQDPHWVDKGALDQNVRSALSVPLVYQDEAIGVMTIASPQVNAFLPQHLVLAEAIATLIAGVIFNARLYQANQRHAQEAERLRQITLQLSQTLDPQRVLDAILTALQGLVPYDTAVIQGYDEAQQAIYLLEARGPWQHELDHLKHVRVPLQPTSPHGQVLHSGQPIIVADLQQAYGTYQHRFFQSLPGRSLLGIPLRTSTGIQGMLMLTQNEPGFYTSDHARLAMAFSTAAALALENSHLFALEQEQRQLAEALMEAMAIINEPLDVHEVVGRILERLDRVVPGDSSNVMLLQGDQVRLFQRYQANAPDSPLPQKLYPLSQLPLLHKIIRTREPIIINDTSQEPLWVVLEGSEIIKAYLGVPIHKGEEIIGFLNVNSKMPYRFTPVMARRLQAFADQVAIALEHARLYEQLRSYATTLEERVAARTQDLAAQTARLQAILRSVNEGLVVLQKDGTILEANALAESWLQEALPSEARYRLRQALTDLAAHVTEKPIAMLELPRLDLQLRAAPVADTGLVVVALTDVTSLKSLERMKSQLITTLSHELRTPITTIRLYVRLLEKASPAQTPEYLTALKLETERLTEILEDVLRISRLDAGQLRLHVQTFDLNEVIEQILLSQEWPFEEKGLTLSGESDEKPLLISADRGQITQLLQSLITNARLYTPTGGSVRVTLSLDKSSPSPRARITVEDTGVGIPEEELPYIFDRFYRGSAGQNHQIPGTGLGLAIVKEIVNLHRGEITVQNTPGKGTCFTVWLPLTPSPV